MSLSDILSIIGLVINLVIMGLMIYIYKNTSQILDCYLDVNMDTILDEDRQYHRKDTKSND